MQVLSLLGAVVDSIYKVGLVQFFSVPVLRNMNMFLFCPMRNVTWLFGLL